MNTNVNFVKQKCQKKNITSVTFVLTAEIKTMTMNKDLYTMVGLAEGFVEGTELEVIEAWQYLHDSGHAYKLQGWFGRTAQALLEEGIIE